MYHRFFLSKYKHNQISIRDLVSVLAKVVYNFCILYISDDIRHMQNWCCKSSSLVIFFDRVVDSLKMKQLKKSFFRPGLFGAAQCGALWFKSNTNGGYDIKAEKN